MRILMDELGNQGSRYLAQKLAVVEPGLLQVSPDMFIKSKLEQGDPAVNPLLEMIMPLISQSLGQRGDLIITPFPHDIEPSVLIADPLRDRGYHAALRQALSGLVGNGVVSAVDYNTSFYKY
jgi:hypothetical protein